jgi:hypothetical protein
MYERVPGMMPPSHVSKSTEAGRDSRFVRLVTGYSHDDDDLTDKEQTEGVSSVCFDKTDKGSLVAEVASGQDHRIRTTQRALPVRAVLVH